MNLYFFQPQIILHLLGYNHDNERDEKEMEELEVNYLSELNIKNPYEIRV